MRNKYILGSLGLAATLVSLQTGCVGGSSDSAALRYPTDELALRKGQAIQPLSPNVVPLQGRFSVSPALPAGLSLDEATGVISGTPAEPRPRTVPWAERDLLSLGGHFAIRWETHRCAGRKSKEN